MKAGKPNLAREFKHLFRSMSFVSRQPSLNGRGPQGERFAEIYQQLGLLWEFLALQCRHTDGWRKTREGKLSRLRRNRSDRFAPPACLRCLNS